MQQTIWILQLESQRMNKHSKDHQKQKQSMVHQIKFLERNSERSQCQLIKKALSRRTYSTKRKSSNNLPQTMSKDLATMIMDRLSRIRWLANLTGTLKNSLRKTRSTAQLKTVYAATTHNWEIWMHYKHSRIRITIIITIISLKPLLLLIQNSKKRNYSLCHGTNKQIKHSFQMWSSCVRSALKLKRNK